MNKQAQAYYEGFFEAALDSGMSPSEATELTKQAADNSSFLGRYLAAVHAGVHRTANSPYVSLGVKKKLDPSGKLQDERLFYTPDEIKKQRQLNYDEVPEKIHRSSAGGLLPNILTGAGVGALAGPYMADIQAQLNNYQLHAPAYAIAAGIGAGVGGLAGGLGRGIGQYIQNKITPEDIKRMKIQQKDRSAFSEMVPFRNVYDAINA
jgi:hypothetical protein